MIIYTEHLNKLKACETDHSTPKTRERFAQDSPQQNWSSTSTEFSRGFFLYYNRSTNSILLMTYINTYRYKIN